MSRLISIRGPVPLLLLLTSLSPCAPLQQKGGLAVRDLRTEYLNNPNGLEETKPRFTWIVESPARGQKQTAYRILVASGQQMLAQGRGDVWDTGKLASNETVGIAYAGAALHSGQQCYWKVQVWDRDGKPSRWSEPAHWSMGLLSDSDWSAQWISFRDTSPVHSSRDQLYLPPARFYRKALQVSKPVRRAMLYASALGIFDPYVNGRRVSDAMFAPGWSDYRQRAYYRTYDVTALVTRGNNALGAIVADGWYSGYVGFGLLLGYGPNKAGRYIYGKTPALLAQLDIESTDGSHQVVATDSSWRVNAGPLLEADILMGETYDARRELSGWDRAGYDDSKWALAIDARENPNPKATFYDSASSHEVELGFVRPKRMQAYPGPDVRPIAEIRAAKITEPSPGVYIYDMGQNFSGIARLHVKGPAGASVRIRYGEMLYPDGRLMTENLRRARATDTYTLRGAPDGETWTPRFTYHGFQYVEVTGLPGKPARDDITGVVVHSDTPAVSSFSTSDEVANRLFKNIVWTQMSNFVELPTDCPQRDERMGWTGDAQIYARAATYNADTAAFYTKWLDDLEEAQRGNGAFTDYAPYPMQVGAKKVEYGTGWMDAGIIVPYTVYKAYGDRRVIERHYAAMTRFMEFRKRLSPEFRGSKATNDWGDWLAIGSKTPIEYLDAIYFAYTTKLMAEMAAATNHSDDALSYGQLYTKIGDVFRGDYLQSGCRLAVDTQTAYALALFVDLVPADCRKPIAEHLAQMIAGNGYKMTTGFLGTYPLLPVLSQTGHQDLAVRLFQSRKFPSWGYEVANGATTIWERWNSYTKEDGIHEPSMNSFSHYAFGAIGEWMFRSLAGIDTDGAGFQKIVIRPGPPSSDSNPDQVPVNWVRAEYNSIRGKIVSNWKQGPDSLECEVTIPTNTTATIELPSGWDAGITEGGRPLKTIPQLRLTRSETGRAAILAESGTYRLQIEKSR